MRRSLALVMVAMLALAFTSPALGAGRTPTGDRINLFGGDREFAADTPFFIRHGIASLQDEDQAIGRGTFALEIDGVPQAFTYKEHWVADGLLYRTWVFNWPNGMRGIHTFTGHWLTACGVATMDLPCGDGGRQELVEFETHQVTVVFTE